VAQNRRPAPGAERAGPGGDLRVPILYDGGADDWSAQDVRSVLECVEGVAAALDRAGHDALAIPVQRDLNWVDAARDADVVFNLCEGIGGISHFEYRVASVLELLGVPFTGTSAWTMTVCHRKPVLNGLLHQWNLPIPEWRELRGEGAPAGFPLPAIVKPAAEDASVGIEQASVVTTAAALAERVTTLQRSFDAVMVQRYIPGRELAVGFVGARTLPISEIDFSRMPDGSWPIVSFQAKWVPGSPDDIGTQPVCPARVAPRLKKRLVELARAAWAAVDGQGYGRVDMRVDEKGQPWVLEVNPNPDASPDAGLARMAAAVGWDYDQLILQILDEAVTRASTVPASNALRQVVRA
jgi:D-alanine-D-alanine ligase